MAKLECTEVMWPFLVTETLCQGLATGPLKDAGCFLLENMTGMGQVKAFCGEKGVSCARKGEGLLLVRGS